MELFSLTITIALYLFFQKFKERYKSTWINPLLFSAIGIIIILLISNTTYETYNQGVKFITLLLGPATVSLAIPLHEHKDTIINHSKLIFVSVISGVITHAITLGILSKLLSLSTEMIATTAPKSVTTAIAKDIALQNGGFPEITIPLVILTGIFGAIISDTVFKKFNIKSKISKGLALGVSAHAVGTSKAVEYGALEATMATIALILTGLFTVLSTPLILFLLN